MNATVKGIPWKILFPMALWQLWLHKNNFVFRTGTVDHKLRRKCSQYNIEFYSIGLEAKIKQSKTIVPVGWEKPPRGWMKLNSDGLVLRNLRRAGGGGLIQDHDGSWVKGYARGLGHTNSIMAELWALRDGLVLAKEMGLNNLVIELDALSVVILMNNGSENLLIEPLLTD